MLRLTSWPRKAKWKIGLDMSKCRCRQSEEYPCPSATPGRVHAVNCVPPHAPASRCSTPPALPARPRPGGPQPPLLHPPPSPFPAETVHDPLHRRTVDPECCLQIPPPQSMLGKPRNPHQRPGAIRFIMGSERLQIAEVNDPAVHRRNGNAGIRAESLRQGAWKACASKPTEP